MLVMAHPPAAPLPISPSEREVLERLVRARTTEQRVAQRARIVLGAADGVANKRIAAELGVALMTVQLWRRRYDRAAWPAWPMRRAQVARRPIREGSATGSSP